MLLLDGSKVGKVVHMPPHLHVPKLVPPEQQLEAGRGLGTAPPPWGRDWPGCGESIAVSMGCLHTRVRVYARFCVAPP